MRKPIAATSGDTPSSASTPTPARRSTSPAETSASAAASSRRAASSAGRAAGDRGAAGVGRDALEDMLQRAASGDQDAWRTLVETYSGRVFGLIRAHCNSIDLAEEITQSTFCTVVAKIESYTELGRFEQWLFRIAMNRLRDEMRRRKRQARPVEDDSLAVLAEGEGPAGGPGGATRSGGGIDALFAHVGPAELAALRTALTQLSDSDQHIIHLRHSAGLSFKEIAEVLEQPLGTVLARQHRALKKLAEVLKSHLGRDHPLVGEGPAGRSARVDFDGNGAGGGPENGADSP